MAITILDQTDKAELEQKIAEASHTHDNKSVLDKFGRSNNGSYPTFKANDLTEAKQLTFPEDVVNRDNALHRAIPAKAVVEGSKVIFKNGVGTGTEIFSFELPESYTPEEIDEMISRIPKFTIEVVESLPTENISDTTVYLVKDTETNGNLYTEYIFVNNAWECLGSQQIDLEGYAKTEDIPTKTSELENDSGFVTAEDLPESDFSQFIEETAASVNLYAPTTEGWINNAFITSNGQPTVNDTSYKGYLVTPLIPVIGGKTYTVKPSPFAKSAADINKARTYDFKGTPLAAMAFTDNADGSSTFTVPDGSETIRLSVLKMNFGSSGDPIDLLVTNFNKVFMLVEGTTAPEQYVPYGKGDYRLKDIEIPEKSVKLSKLDDEILPIFAPLAGKKIVNFGDSIFGNARPPEDVSTFLAKKTGAEVLNCAFGGCRMSVHVGHWDAFSMYRLAYSIANNDFALQDEAINYDDRTSYAEEPLALIKATDFSNVDIVTIGYGTNDFTGNAPIDNETNLLDTTTLAGALRYSIETLLTAYPNLKIFILSTTYRAWIDKDNGNAFLYDSNTFANGNEVKLADYNKKLAEVADEYNLPFVDNYSIGINQFNRLVYFPVTDGTHHNETGRKLIASHLAKELY